MTNNRRAVFLDHPSLDLGDLDLSELRNSFSDLQLYAHTTPQNVVERLQGAQVAISNKIALNTETLEACPELKLILVSATGTNNVDLAAARAHGITVSNCQGYGTPSVAQHTIMLLLNLATRLNDYQRDVAAGKWQEAKQFCLLDYPIVELEGKTLGLLGHGELGSAVARLAEAFGMRVVLGAIPGRPPAPTACHWMNCSRRSTRSRCTARSMNTPATLSVPANWRCSSPARLSSIRRAAA